VGGHRVAICDFQTLNRGAPKQEKIPLCNLGLIGRLAPPSAYVQVLGTEVGHSPIRYPHPSKSASEAFQIRSESKIIILGGPSLILRLAFANGILSVLAISECNLNRGDRGQDDARKYRNKNDSEVHLTFEL